MEYCDHFPSKAAVTQIWKNLPAILKKWLHVSESCDTTCSYGGNRSMTGGKDDTFLGALGRIYGLEKKNNRTYTKKIWVAVTTSQSLWTLCIIHINISFCLLIHNTSLKFIPSVSWQSIHFHALWTSIIYFPPHSCAVHSKFLPVHFYSSLRYLKSVWSPTWNYLIIAAFHLWLSLTPPVSSCVTLCQSEYSLLFFLLCISVSAFLLESPQLSIILNILKISFFWSPTDSWWICSCPLLMYEYTFPLSSCYYVSNIIYIYT